MEEDSFSCGLSGAIDGALGGSKEERDHDGVERIEYMSDFGYSGL